MKDSIAGRLLVALAGATLAAAALIKPENDVPSWASDSTMQLSLSSSRGSLLPVDYNIVPLTENLGLNGSEVVRGVRWILNPNCVCVARWFANETIPRPSSSKASCLQSRPRPIL